MRDIAQDLIEPSLGFAREEEMPISRAAIRSGGIPEHGEAARDVKSADARPGCRAARSGRAISSARGYWLDCTPTSATKPKFPFRR